MAKCPSYFCAAPKCHAVYCRLKRESLITFSIGSFILIVVIVGVMLVGARHKPLDSRHTYQTQKTSVLLAPADKIAVNMQRNSLNANAAQMMQQKLAMMQAFLSKSSLSTSKLGAIQAQMKSFSQLLIQMQASNEALKKAALQSQKASQVSQQLTSQQVADVQAQLSTLSKAVVPPNYLPISDLEFQVVGIDFWNGKPMVSVAMKDVNGVTHYRLMGQGMSFQCERLNQLSCTRWTLNKINTAPNVALFENQKGQKIKVEL